jgi:hypothetical protein
MKVFGSGKISWNEGDGLHFNDCFLKNTEISGLTMLIYFCLDTLFDMSSLIAQRNFDFRN